MTVNVPPRPVQHLKKVRRVVPFNRKPPGKSGIDMSMRIDKAGHDNASVRIDKFRLRIFFLHIFTRPDFPDQRSVDNDGAVFQIGISGISRKYSSSAYDKHMLTSSPFLRGLLIRPTLLFKFTTKRIVIE